MRAKPTCAVHVTLTGRNFVKEPNETTGVIAAVPGILHSKLVGFEFIVAAYAKEIQIEDQTEAVEAILQGVVRANACDAAGQYHGCNLRGLIENPGNRGSLHEFIRVPRCVMCHFMRENSREFRFIVSRFEQTSFDEKVASGKRKRIDFTGLEN